MYVVLFSLLLASTLIAAPVCKTAASDACLEDPFPPVASSDSLAIFDHATGIVSRCFYDRSFAGVHWVDEVKRARVGISAATSREELQNVLNGLLRQLRASHTEFLSSADQRYWTLKAIFTGQVDGAPLRQAGALFDRVGDRWFVRSIFAGSSFASAGILAGDEIVRVDGQKLRPVESFELPAHTCADVRYRRSEGGPVRQACVLPSFESFQRSMLRATYRSTKIYEKRGKRIGYFRLWAGTHETFRQSLEDAAKGLEPKVEALVLDIRDGLGGAHAGYLDSFFKGAFSKPLYLLINEGSKSGKETLAYLLKTKKRATLVGTKTGGAYVGGRLFDIAAGKYAMYLAVCGDPPVGVKLEGIGVSPDVEVKEPLPYSQGVDLALDRAIDLASSK